MLGRQSRTGGQRSRSAQRIYTQVSACPVRSLAYVRRTEHIFGWAEFWDLGNELFRSNCAVTFVAGDLFDNAFLDPSCNRDAAPPGSLTPMLGGFTVIHVGAFFHLFDLERQKEAARRCLALLSPEAGAVFKFICPMWHRAGTFLSICDPTGSVIIGSNIGSDVAGGSLGGLPHLHNADSWQNMWRDVVGDHSARIEVSARLVNLDGYLGNGARQVATRKPLFPSARGPTMWLVWSIRRLWSPTRSSPFRKL
jgi:hypothetical protein